jgi:hypothetical protein
VDCYKDYVGLTACFGAYETSPSGQYINSLAGITWDNIDNLADKDQRDFEGVWDDVQANAARRFKLDVMTAINGCYKLNKECDYEAILCDEGNMEKLTAAWMYLLGIHVMHERLYTPRLNRYTTVDRNQAKELLEFYQGEYSEFLKQAVALLDVSECELNCSGGDLESVIYYPGPGPCYRILPSP